MKTIATTMPEPQGAVGPLVPPRTSAPPVRNRPAVGSLLHAARATWHEAARASRPTERYAAAHLAALRAAAAVLAARAVATDAAAGPTAARPSGGRVRGRPASAWSLLTVMAPELAEWAAFFSAGAPKRAAAEAGITRAVTEREADDLLREVETFLALVHRVVESPPARLDDARGSHDGTG